MLFRSTIMPESSMWVYVKLPDELKKYEDANNDLMAVFADSKCCGVAEIITKNENEVIYKILVKNIASSGKLDVRYYSSYNSYLFQMPSLISFVPNGNYGSFDEPNSIPFNLENIYPFSMKAYFELPANLQKGSLPHTHDHSQTQAHTHTHTHIHTNTLRIAHTQLEPYSTI